MWYWGCYQLLNSFDMFRRTIRRPGIRVKHGPTRAFTHIVVTLYADVFIYKTKSCCSTVFRKKVLAEVSKVLLE
jgi:hypothetical protein